jgi:hypothetical protein
MKLEVLGLLVLLVISVAFALNYYFYSADLEKKLLSAQNAAKEAENALNITKSRLEEVEMNLSKAEQELEKAKREMDILRGNLLRINESLFLCMKNLSGYVNLSGGVRNMSNELLSCKTELSACKSINSRLEEADVHVVHWWYEGSAGCAVCGTSSAVFHIVLFNAGYNAATNVRVVITLYDSRNIPIRTVTVYVGSIDGRTGKVVDQTVTYTGAFQRADVGCYWD